MTALDDDKHLTDAEIEAPFIAASTTDVESITAISSVSKPDRGDGLCCRAE